MALYRVAMMRTVRLIQSTETEVEADSEKDAADKALEEADNGDLEWRDLQRETTAVGDYPTVSLIPPTD